MDFTTNELELILVGTPAYGAEPQKVFSKNLIESYLIKALNPLELNNKYKFYIFIRPHMMLQLY